MFPLISIRIPLYNHGEYIEQCLDSILHDSYPNKELVIIDDGSQDDSKVKTELWVKQNNSKMTITFISRENRGVTKTLNELNKLCKGEYIVGIASDDYLLPDSILLRYNYMKENGCKVLFADCNVVDETGKFLCSSALKDKYRADTSLYFSKKTLIYEIINNWSIPGSTLMVHSSMYDMFNYDEKSIIEDYDFFLFAVAKEELCFFDKQVSAYRIHSKNSYLNAPYLKRRISMVRALLRNFIYFSTKYRLLILKKIFWILRKIILNRIGRTK